MNERQELQQAIATLESQRAILGDAVVNTSLAALRTQLAQLDNRDPAAQKRMLATILFMDMAAHTAMIHDLDLEDQLEVIDQALARLSEPVKAFGGQITRYQGDGFKAVFGLPSGDEYDPDHAIQAGLAIQRVAQDIATELENDWGLHEFKVRIGIDTGMIIAGGLIEGEDSISGPAVNLAAKLEKTAEPGTVVISQHTYQHVRGVFDLQPLEPLLVRGFDEPVPIYNVLRSKPRSFRTRRRGVEGVDTRMIGRSAELTQLQDAFQQMSSDGVQQWITITGEAGLGKSRLLYEFEHWVDMQPQFITLYRARARQETQQVSYGLLRNLFAFRFRIRDDDPHQEMRRKIVAGFEEWLEPGEETLLKAQIVGRLLGYNFSNATIRALEEDPKQLRNRALAAMIEYFRAVSSSPVIALLEDLHWADDSSLDILIRLSLIQTERPVLIVAAARPELSERRPDFMRDQPYHHWLKLKPLSMSNSRRLVKEILKKAVALPDNLRDEVAAKADGNPYYVEELVKMLVADGIIVKEDSGWHILAQKLTMIQIPTTVAGVLQARLNSLPQIERAIMQRASIMGRIFWNLPITNMNYQDEEQLSVIEVEAGLAALRNKEMIYKLEASEFAGSDEYTFKHAILRDVTYESVLKWARKTYHALAANWLMDQSEQRAWKHTGLIAHQLELGGQREKAVTYLHRAGEEAASRFANAEALNFYTRALDLCQENDLESLFDLRVIRLNILHRMGQRDQEEQDLLAAETTAERLNDSEKLAAINWHWAIFHANTGDNDAAIECAKACTNMARELGNQELEARGHLAWGRVLWRQGKLSEAHSRLQNALLLARKAGLKRLEANALLNLGNVVGDQGDIPGARSYYDQSLAIDRETKNHTGEGIVLNNLGILSAQGGNFVDAQTYFEQSLEIAKLTGNIAGEGLALGNLGNVTADRGDFASSRDYFEQYLTNAQRTRNRPGQGYALNGIGHALLGLGQCVEAAKYYKEAVQLREDLKVEHLAIESRAGWARSVLAAGDGPQALRLVEPILTFIESSGTLDRFESLLIYLTCIHVLQANEDLRSEQLLQTAYELVQGQANKINDPDERRSFLENVEANHEIMRLWWSAHSITK